LGRPAEPLRARTCHRSASPAIARSHRSAPGAASRGRGHDAPRHPGHHPARTLFDLAAVLTPNRLERAIDQAEVLRLTSPTSLEALVARHAGRRGTTALKRILDDHEIGRTITRSHLEDRFLAFLDARGLPRPQMNALIEVHGRRIEVDCLWCEPRLIAELDGFATHATRHAFERDRERDRELQAEGWRVVRITARQLEEDPDTIESQLRRLLRDTVSEP